MNDSISRRYVWVLAVIAVVIVAGGALLRPKKVLPEPRSPSETAYLQARLRMEELGEIATYFEQRAQAFGRFVRYPDEGGASAIVWRAPGELLTVRSNGAYAAPFVVLANDVAGLQPPEIRDPSTGRWLLIVGRTSGDRLLWVPAIYGGARQTTCSGVPYKELMIDSRLDSALLGAGAFELSGSLAGVVFRCGGGLHLISSESIDAFMRQFSAPERRVPAKYGFRLTEAKANPEAPLEAAPGLLVTEVMDGQAASAAGLKAGDMIVEAGGQPARTEAAVYAAVASADPDQRALATVRNGKRATIRMPSADDAERIRGSESTLGIRMPPPDGSLPIAVAPGSRADMAGLRTGDRIVEAGRRRIRSASELERFLSKDSGPVMIVYRRGTSEHATVVSR